MIKNNSKINISCFTVILTVILFFMIQGPVSLFAVQLSADSTGLVAPDSAIGYSQQKSEMDGYFFRVIWVTIFILALIIAGFYIYRKSMGRFVSTGKSPIKIVARYNLGPRQMLVVVHIDKQKLLLGVTENGINLLKDFGPAPENEDEIEIQQTLSSGFGAILNKLKKDN